MSDDTDDLYEWIDGVRTFSGIRGGSKLPKAKTYAENERERAELLKRQAAWKAKQKPEKQGDV
jgi:hypothetical protein